MGERQRIGQRRVAITLLCARQLRDGREGDEKDREMKEGKGTRFPKAAFRVCIMMNANGDKGKWEMNLFGFRDKEADR